MFDTVCLSLLVVASVSASIIHIKAYIEHERRLYQLKKAVKEAGRHV